MATRALATSNDVDLIISRLDYRSAYRLDSIKSASFEEAKTRVVIYRNLRVPENHHIEAKLTNFQRRRVKMNPEAPSLCKV